MLHLMKLEDRIVLDGAAVGEAIDHAIDHDAVQAEAQMDASFSPDEGPESERFAEAAAGAAALLADPEPAEVEPVEVVLIADNLPDYEQLVDAVDPEAKVIVYDADGETAEEVMEKVAALSKELGRPIESVSILSHGGEGTFRLGADDISTDTLADHSEAWETLKTVLADNGRVNIFGCNVSGEAGGQGLLDVLAEATGASVFASDDATGAGGDWELEAASSRAVASYEDPLDVEMLADYSASLAEPNITGSPDSTVSQGETYTFTPTVEDSDGDVVEFTISRQPEWAAFNPQTGQLSGTPGNEHVGTYTDIVIGVYDSQGNNAELTPFSITVENANDAPTISSTPPNTVQEGNDFSFTPNAADIDLREGVDPNEKISFTIENKPDWASFDEQTGRLYGTPPMGIAGTVHRGIVITVEDNYGEKAEMGPFDITVVELNNAPEISGEPPTEVDEDNSYDFSPTASDAEDDLGDLKFSISNQPDWSNFDANTGRLWGVPENEDVGVYNDIRITVTDSGGLQDNLAPFSITVNNINDPPQISGRPADRVQEGVDYEFTPTVKDPDANDDHNFTIQNKPDWANFDPATGRLHGTPQDADVGSYDNIIITVSDIAGKESSINFNIQVVDVNEGPVITGDPPTSVLEDEEYVFTPQYTDPENDPVEFSISNQPAWATFDAETGELRGIPVNDEVRVYENIIITVTDATGLSSSLAPFDIEVINVNDPPAITGTSSQTVQVDQDYSFIPTVKDVDLRVDDNEELTYSIEGQPDWTNFDADTGELSGTPNMAHVGTTGPITITVTDAGGLTANMTFTIKVVPLNTPPTIDGQPATEVYQGGTYYFVPTNVSDNEDAPGDLRFSISKVPSWATFNEETGELSGTPANDDVGIYRDIVITVTDTGGLSDSLPAFDLIVYNVNDQPEIISEAQKRVRIGANYEFIPTGFDPDLKPSGGDDLGIVNPEEKLTFSFDGLPTWITSTSQENGRIWGTVDIDAIRNDLASGLAVAPEEGEGSVFAIYNITITVTDEGIGDPRIPHDARQAVNPIDSDYTYQLRILSPGPGLGNLNPLDFIENRGPVSVGDIDVEDGGSNISNLEVEITDNYQNDAAGRDVLLFDDMTFDSGRRITGRWVADTGTLTLTGNATAAEYQQALRSIRFDHVGGAGNGDNPFEAINPADSDRTLTFTITDVNGQQDTADMLARVDAINDAPVLKPENQTIYVNGDDEVAIAPDFEIADIDDDNMQGAVIRISGNYERGEDVLHFSDTGNISGQWDANQGVLRLTGVATKEAYARAIQSITYENINDAPTGGQRAITITVTDNNSNGVGSGRLDGAPVGGPESDTVTSGLNIVTSHNRPPIDEPIPERPDYDYFGLPDQGQDPLGLGPVNFPGDVLDTGLNLPRLAKDLVAPCGNDVLYECCTLEEALRIGCRLAPAIDPEARLCNITWDYMSNTLGWEDPFVTRINGQYFNEELDLFNRLFMKDVESDPGFHLDPGAFAQAFGMEEEAKWAQYNRDEEYDVYSQLSMQGTQGFNDMAPGELKEAFLKGMDGMDRPGRWDDDGDATGC